MRKLPWMKEYIEATQASIGNMDLGTLQPFGWLEFEPLFAKELLDKIKELMKRARAKNITPQELAHLWPTAAGLRCPLYFTLLNMKCAQLPKKERIAIAQFFFDMIKERAVADIYGGTSNICQTQEQIKELFKRVKFEKGSPETARLLAKIYNAAYNLSCGIYIDFYLDYCAENEGSYDVSALYGLGHILVIKKFVNLKTPFWPELKMPYNNLSFYTVYKNVKFTCDMISVHSIYEGDVINNLVAYAVIADGKVIINTEFKKILEELSQRSVEQWQRLKSLDFEKQKEKALYSKCYGMKKLFEKVGMDWQPTEAMQEAVKNKPLKDNSYWKIPTKNQKEYWNKMYDPAIDFYPGDEL